MNSKNILNIKYENLVNKYSDIELLPTFNKICFAQNLLKEMNSLKERFDDNKNKMISQIEQNCYKYYKKKITAKEIYDYFESNNLQEHIDYKLINNTENSLNKKSYSSVYEFLFFIRNNFSSVVKIINKCDLIYHKNLSYFFVHLFYEDTSTYSFFQEEILILSYYIFESLIIERMPKELKFCNIIINDDFYLDFCFYFMNSLTKKADIRNYFCSFLSDLILKIENYENNLSPDIKIISKDLGIKEIIEKDNKKNKLMKIKTVDERQIMKTKKRIKEMINNSNNDLKRKINSNDQIPKKYKNESNFFDFEVIEINTNAYLEERKNKNGSFFDRENITMQYIYEKLVNYENMKNKKAQEYAISYYLENLLTEITGEGEPVEIYSNIILRNKLKLLKINGDEKSLQKIISSFKNNYDFITSFINILLFKIKENIKSLPYILKCIFKLIDEIFKKKYSLERPEIYNFNILIFKARLYLGSIILPLLYNADSTGIFVDKIISKVAKENLNLIVEIIKKGISGNLFLVEDEGFTIYNKYLINIMPKIFEIIINMNQEFIMPDYINKLINKDNKNTYNYFDEKKEEKIQFQSICISPLEIKIFREILEKNKDPFIIHNKNKEEKYIFKSFLSKSKDFIYDENISKKKINYYIFTKINYKPDFDNQIKAIIQDSFEIFFQNQNNDDVFKFKKCLSVVLTYINYLQKEEFVSLIQRKEEINLLKNNQIVDYYNSKKNLLYKNTKFEVKSKIKKIEVKTQDDLTFIKKNLKKIGEQRFQNLEKMGRFFMQRKSIINSIHEIKEDIDFKKLILPKISSKIISELYFNPQKIKSHRILFCISYIQEHINDLPFEYKQQNYKNIFDEIIQETIFMIKELQNNILKAFYDKIRNSEKLNLVLNKDFEQIKNLEIYSYAGYLFNKIIVKGNFTITKKKRGEEEIIENVQLELNKVTNKNMNIDTIQSFVDKMPNFNKNTENNNDILEFEKKLKIDEILKLYFNELKNVVKNEKIISRFSEEDILLIIYELENYILLKLYGKLYPKKETKADIFFYKKSCRLDFIKPENLINNKKMINEKLLQFAINDIKEMNRQLTPIDKIKNFWKAIDILKNSMTFNSGKTDLGLDDTLPFIIYIVLKSKLKNICTTLDYCTTYINQEFAKKNYGNLLIQLDMVIKIIQNMKYNELINVSKEQFGNDE